MLMVDARTGYRCRSVADRVVELADAGARRPSVARLGRADAVAVLVHVDGETSTQPPTGASPSSNELIVSKTDLLLLYRSSVQMLMDGHTAATRRVIFAASRCACFRPQSRALRLRKCFVAATIFDKKTHVVFLKIATAFRGA